MVERMCTDADIETAHRRPAADDAGPPARRVRQAGQGAQARLHGRLGAPQAQRPGAAHGALQGPVQEPRRAGREADRDRCDRPRFPVTRNGVRRRDTVIPLTSSDVTSTPAPPARTPTSQPTTRPTRPHEDPPPECRRRHASVPRLGRRRRRRPARGVPGADVRARPFRGRGRVDALHARDRRPGVRQQAVVPAARPESRRRGRAARGDRGLRTRPDQARDRAARRDDRGPNCEVTDRRRARSTSPISIREVVTSTTAASTSHRCSSRRTTSS